MSGIGRRDRLSLFPRALIAAVCALLCILICAAAGADADNPRIRLSEEWLVLSKDETARLTAEVTGYSGKATVTMESSNPMVATVSKNVVKGVAAGETVIVVTAQLADGRELETECYVTVEIAVQSISAKKQHFDLREGDEVQAEVEIRPAEASGIGLDWFSSNEDAIEVDPDGMLYAVGAGSATITARLMDGSGRSVTFTASVPSLAAPQSVVQITTRNPDPVIVNYYGRHFERDISITCTGAGATSWSEFDETSHEIRFHLIPLTAADYDITVRDLSGAGSSVSVKCRVDHSACYDTTAYPYINYENVARDPSRYHSVGSLKGYINSVSRTEDGWAFRVGVGGTAARALMVTIVDDSNTPLYIVGDVINVYGTLSGEYPGTDLPWMVADRIAGSFGEMIAP